MSLHDHQNNGNTVLPEFSPPVLAEMPQFTNLLHSSTGSLQRCRVRDYGRRQNSSSTGTPGDSRAEDRRLRRSYCSCVRRWRKPYDVHNVLRYTTEWAIHGRVLLQDDGWRYCNSTWCVRIQLRVPLEVCIFMFWTSIFCWLPAKRRMWRRW